MEKPLQVVPVFEKFLIQARFLRDGQSSAVPRVLQLLDPSVIPGDGMISLQRRQPTYYESRSQVTGRVPKASNSSRSTRAILRDPIATPLTG
jgi:hypothetical protein